MVEPPSPVVDNGITGGFPADLHGDGKQDGHGTFNVTTTFDVSNNGSGPAIAAHFNADGRLDLATRNSMNNGTVSVLLQVPAP